MLYAVSIKGSSAKEFYKNTKSELNEELFWRNLDLLIECGFPFYFTYTGLEQTSIDFFNEEIVSRYGYVTALEDSFKIDIIHYNALDYAHVQN